MKYIYILIIPVFLVTTGSCSRNSRNGETVTFGDSIYLAGIPPQPDEDSWKFIEDLKSPMWTKHEWPEKFPGPGYADLSSGVSIKTGFPDDGKRLETAYEDLKSFLTAGGLNSNMGKYIIETAEDKTLQEEWFRIDVKPGKCLITAGDAEGIRRGIFCLEDEMLRLRGPSLPLGIIEKQPFIKRRISRCFFGPVKRFPRMKDELMDDVDYYPDQYLNRLAHEGVNGLWLTIEFKDLVSTKYTPDAGKDGERRLSKLRQTVEKCLRYGIRTYIFCIEPRAWNAGNPVIEQYPELAGAPAGESFYFCPMSNTARDYLYETVNKIFKAVPDLGGMINITHGERGTTCCSAISNTSEYSGGIQCPRCADREPWEILHASLSAMEKGMHDAAPGAELISWLYMPHPQRFLEGDPYGLGKWVYDLPAHTPEGVILQFNFESGVTRTEFGKLLVGGDYWISNPGPSDRFVEMAEKGKEHGIGISAKIQTGCSHEVATVPFVPLPSLLYSKFRAMKELGVTHSMLCWYFGNYPGLMNKSAGMLSMEPFPEDARTFMYRLASLYWKKEDVPKVVEAWQHFADGYENYPLTNLFQYYGPVHDGPVWPLLLKPADAPLSPSWLIASPSTLEPWPPSGDRIGECLGDVLTLDEVVELARRMTESYEKGTAIFEGIKGNYVNERERMLDISVSEALGIQLQSGYNILKFYQLREKMFRMDGKERLKLLKQLKKIIREEISLDKKLLALCENDTRLGFHSEAEGYKYFPAKIRWRMEQLEKVLENDVPAVRRIIRKGRPLFPEYTGKDPQGPLAACNVTGADPISGPELILPSGLSWQPLEYGGRTAMRWSSAYDNDNIYIIISDRAAEVTDREKPPVSMVEVKIESERLYPAAHYIFDNDYPSLLPNHISGYPLIWKAAFRTAVKNGECYTVSMIPFKNLRLTHGNLHPVRVDVRVRSNEGSISSWRPDNPLTSRLIHGSDNPADPGWLVFGNTK